MAKFKLFNLQTSKDEDKEYKRAIHSAKAYVESMVKSIGRPARVHGEYFFPGERQEIREKWMPEMAAAEYTHMKIYELRKHYEEGQVRRRMYKRKNKRIFYEYLIMDLEKFIEAKDYIS